MKLKRLFNKAIILNNLKRFWWVSLLYTLGLFLLSPLIVLTQTGDNRRIIEIDFNMIFDSTILFLCIVPVFLAVIVFRYMQNQKAMVTMHSMPYSRLDLYVNNIISGLILLVTPIVLNTAFLSYIELFVTNGIVFESGIVMDFLWISVLVSVTLFAWTTIVGMVTGSSIAQIIFTYISNFLPVGVVALLNYLLDGVIYGFGGVSETFIIKLAKISPIVQAVYFMNEIEAISSFIWWDVAFIIIAFIIGYFIYKYRNLEDAGEVISGKFIKPVFKYGVTVCVMLVGVAYVRGIFDMKNPNFLVFLLFALLGYVVSEMLLKKSFKILKSYKGFVGFVGVFAICVACIHFDVLGYEDYVPKVSDVECFAIDSYGVTRYAEYGDKTNVLFSKENIEKVIKINQDIVNNKEENVKVSSGSTRISYRLNNGRIVNRQYQIDYNKYNDAINEIFMSNEYKMANISLFSRDISEIDSIRITNEIFQDNYYTVLFNKEDISDMVNVMKQDILSSNYHAGNVGKYYSLSNSNKNLYSVEVVYKNKTIKGEAYYGSEYLYFNKDSINVCKFIEKKVSDIVVKVEDISSIEINGQDDKVTVITNREEIESMLSKISDYNLDEPYYSNSDILDDRYIVRTKIANVKVNFIDGNSEWIYGF